MQTRQISVVPQVLYSYRKGLTGCITAGTEKMIIDWLRNMLDLQDILKACNLWNEQVALQWVKVVIWRIAAFRKLPADVRVAQTTLLQQAFSRAKQIVWEGGWHTKLRWGGLFALVSVCGWQSVYFWAKLFR